MGLFSSALATFSVDLILEQDSISLYSTVCDTVNLHSSISNPTMIPKCHVRQCPLAWASVQTLKAVKTASMGTPFAVLLKSVEYNRMFDSENVLLNTQ